MKKYEVILEGTFCKEVIIEAASEEEAEKKANEQFERTIGLTKEDYVVDSASVIPESM